MSLKKPTGNMYPWVTHTHCHLGGECPHGCVYCYIDHFPFGRPAKYQGPLRLIKKEFAVQYGTGKTIFIENCNDLFADAVPDLYIEEILSHCLRYPDNTYVFQTKNPVRYIDLAIKNKTWACDPFNRVTLAGTCFPENSLFGCTIETTKMIRKLSNAPDPYDRVYPMKLLRGRKFITIEPILDFDVDILASWMDQIRPEFVNIGADSKSHNLPEPSADKIQTLIEKLTGYGIEIREKHNLERLMK
jgi:hypothetical protein